ncbi:hypothetical protein VPH35_024912 [Triticum aestivum]
MNLAFTALSILMEKPTNQMRAIALLLSQLLLVCFAFHAQCRTTEGMDNEKINIPGGLCVHHRDCSPGNCCYWCLVVDDCYPSLEECQKECKKHILGRLFNLPSP